MHRSPRLLASCLVMALAAATVAGAARSSADAPFDYLVLALSWSPTYCASPDGRDNRQQCAADRRHAFVVHGLWPQHERGWPEFCATGRTWVPEEVVRSMLDIMPSRNLVIHQWRKHGTCAGMDPDDYFAETRALYERIRIPDRYRTPSTPVVTTPDDLERDFVAANPWLRPDMISVDCGNRRDRAALRGIRLCFGDDLEPRACGANEARQCRARTLVLPPVR